MTATLPKSREIDCRVAAVLGWTEIESSGDWLASGIAPPGHPSEGKRIAIPAYSTSTAALLALEEFTRDKAATVELYFNSAWADAERWHAGCRGEEYMAPTPWAAICKLICASE